MAKNQCIYGIVVRQHKQSLTTLNPQGTSL